MTLNLLFMPMKNKNSGCQQKKSHFVLRYLFYNQLTWFMIQPNNFVAHNHSRK